MILFEELYPGLYEHSAPIMEELCRRGYSIGVVTSASECLRLKACLSLYSSSIHAAFYPLEGKINYEGVQALFTTVPSSPGSVFRSLDSPVDIPRIAIPHGLTDKNNKFPAYFLGHPLGYFNVLFASGQEMFVGSWERYVKRHPSTIHSLKCVITGVPKVDRLFRLQNNKEAFRQQLGITNDKPVVLYAPTFQQEASLEQWGEEIIHDLCQLDVNVLVRLHHLSLQRKKNRDWDETLTRFQSEYPNLIRAQEDSTAPFIAADVLVGDVSGACYEYILQDKPVVFIDCPDFFEKHGTDSIAYYGRDAGDITHYSNLHEIVRFNLAHPENKRENRHALISRLIENPGNATMAVVDCIDAMIRGKETFPTWGPILNQRTDILLAEYLMERLARCRNELGSVALYGAGVHADFLFNLIETMKERSIPSPDICCILDDNPHRSSMNGIPIVTPENTQGDFNGVILATDYFQEQMKTRCCTCFGDGFPVIDLYEHFPWHKPDSCFFNE